MLKSGISEIPSFNKIVGVDFLRKKLYLFLGSVAGPFLYFSILSAISGAIRVGRTSFEFIYPKERKLERRRKLGAKEPYNKRVTLQRLPRNNYLRL